MENQHRKISGYRELNQDEIDLMNEIKAVGNTLKQLHDRAASRIKQNLAVDGAEQMRWLSIGRTHYQQGLMALTRAIAAPTFE